MRKKHCIVSRRSSEAGLGRISQLDMALTQFGFIGFTLISGDMLGVHTSDEELHGLVHFWRVIGHMLGMDERYYICLVYCISALDFFLCVYYYCADFYMFLEERVVSISIWLIFVLSELFV